MAVGQWYVMYNYRECSLWPYIYNMQTQYAPFHVYDALD